MKTKLFYTYAFIFLLTLVRCDTTEVPPVENLQLKLEDFSCTEAWFTLTNANHQLPANVIIKQNDQVRTTINLISVDTLLYIDSLLPNQTYSFVAMYSGDDGAPSDKVTFTTMDTTNHNFTFEYFEFGEGSSSYFNDVWIFDENNIWAVGDIDLPSGFTNFIKWDGNEWKAIYPYITSSGIEGIWAVDTSLIYFASGSILKYQNGDFGYIIIPGNWQTGQRIEKLWGSSQSNIYGVGPWGTIVYYNGVKWTKLEFDTQWYFYDITGNPETGVAYAIALNSSSDCIVVKLENSVASIFYQQSTSEIKIYSVTLTELNNFIYTPTDRRNAICRISEKTGNVEQIYHINDTFGIQQSSAVSSNDIYYVGPNYSGIGVWILHFNGISYKKIAIPSLDTDNLGSMHAIKDLAVSVGFANNKAYLIKIKRDL